MKHCRPGAHASGCDCALDSADEVALLRARLGCLRSHLLMWHGYVPCTNRCTVCDDIAAARDANEKEVA